MGGEPSPSCLLEELPQGEGPGGLTLNTNTHPILIKAQIIPSVRETHNHIGHTFWVTYIEHKEEELRT